MVQDVIFLIIGCCLIYAGITTSKKNNRLNREGVKTKGIVFDLVKDVDSSIRTTIPVIRFTTIKQEWITERATVGSYSASYTKGQEVDIIYNPRQPAEFMIVSKSAPWLMVVLVLVGVVLIAVGSYHLYFNTVS